MCALFGTTQCIETRGDQGSWGSDRSFPLNWNLDLRKRKTFNRMWWKDSLACPALCDKLDNHSGKYRTANPQSGKTRRSASLKFLPLLVPSHQLVQAAYAEKPGRNISNELRRLAKMDNAQTSCCGDQRIFHLDRGFWISQFGPLSQQKYILCDDEDQHQRRQNAAWKKELNLQSWNPIITVVRLDK